MRRSCRCLRSGKIAGFCNRGRRSKTGLSHGYAVFFRPCASACRAEQMPTRGDGFPGELGKNRRKFRQKGFSVFGWISGTAGWVFRAVTQSMMGIQPAYDGFDVKPCLPSAWKGCRFDRQFRKNRYRIEIRNPQRVQSGVVSLELDGQPLASTFVPYVEDGFFHEIVVTMGSGTTK